MAYGSKKKDSQAHLPARKSLNAQVVGVSVDKPESQIKFIEKYGLTYPMLPDTGTKVIGAHGAGAVLRLAAKRSTFLIDPEGRVARVWPHVKLGGHAEDVVSTIRELSER